MVMNLLFTCSKIVLNSGILLVIVLALVLVFFCCPALCVCIPCCANRQVAKYKGTAIAYLLFDFF